MMQVSVDLQSLLTEYRVSVKGMATKCQLRVSDRSSFTTSAQAETLSRVSPGSKSSAMAWRALEDNLADAIRAITWWPLLPQALARTGDNNNVISSTKGKGLALNDRFVFIFSPDILRVSNRAQQEVSTPNSPMLKSYR